MKELIVAVCDINENYGMCMGTELGKKLQSPYLVHTFTKSSEVLRFVEEHEIYCLIISQCLLSQIKDVEKITDIIVLQEQEEINQGYFYVDKYQKSTIVLQQIVSHLYEMENEYVEISQRKKHWKVIGIYSPIRRCLQTTFALTLGQKIAEEHKVLYMNFENFSGFSGGLKQDYEEDITDLLYYMECEPEKVKKKLPSIVHKINGLDYIPPALSYFDTYEQSGARWIQLFQQIEKYSDYEYLILDLTDTAQGLLAILQYCSRIYTIIKNDHMAIHKLKQYEAWLEMHEQKTILEKTQKFMFPEFKELPIDFYYLTNSELAKYAKAVIQEDLCNEPSGN